MQAQLPPETIAKLQAAGYEVRPSSSHPGAYQWWINSDRDSLAEEGGYWSANTFTTSDVAWIAAQQDAAIVCSVADNDFVLESQELMEAFASTTPD